ncbi:MAG TPA: hypothetical protein PLA87_13255 [Pseudomonadota bacterium]|nr:hypothetical protein [Pseudomonadota bacterium]
MNRNNTGTQKPRKTVAAPLEALATLDLHDDKQRALHDLIRRLHTGRWPLFRAVAMRQIDGVIFEVVQWCGKHDSSYSVVRWRPDGAGMSWQDAATREEAVKMINRK